MSAAMIMIAAVFSAPDAYESSFQQGLDAYRDERYAEAATYFEQLVASKVADPVVFHNLGNAYFMQGRWGAAIANYERALRLEPGLEGAAANLSLALSRAGTHMERPPAAAWQEALLFWDDDMSYRAVRAVAMVAWLAFWALVVLRFFKAFPYQRVASLALLAIALLAGLSAWTKAHPPALAVASAEKVEVRYGIGDTEALRFTLKAGDRVGVERSQQGWLLVRTDEGNRGWAPKEAFVLVGPPFEAYRPVSAKSSEGVGSSAETAMEDS